MFSVATALPARPARTPRRRTGASRRPARRDAALKVMSSPSGREASVRDVRPGIAPPGDGRHVSHAGGVHEPAVGVPRPDREGDGAARREVVEEDVLDTRDLVPRSAIVDRPLLDEGVVAEPLDPGALAGVRL